MTRTGFRVHLVAACGVLVVAIWLSSGTMAPYAATWPYPIVSEPCGYLYNIDHPFHAGVFQMLDGQPRQWWEASPVLRRVLLPLLAYPLMKVAGFELGGFMANLAFHGAALVGLVLFVRRRHGDRAAIAAAWLFALYPGITYWAALPYANASVVPATCALFILLDRLESRPGAASTAVTCGAMGILFTAYDLLPFFGFGAIAVLLRRRRLAEIPIATGCMLVAPVLVWLILTRALDVPWTNANTVLYREVLGSYLHPPAIAVWLKSLAAVPVALVANYLFSSMVFLPSLFLVLVIVTRHPLTTIEKALAAGILLVFCLNNLAPPHDASYQMNGDAMPRLYQPFFVVLVVYCARVVGSKGALPRPKQALVMGAFLILGVAANATIAFGPIARVPWAGTFYHRFYPHANDDTMNRNLAFFGRRPLGFCDPGHPTDYPDPLPPGHRRPEWLSTIPTRNPASTSR